MSNCNNLEEFIAPCPCDKKCVPKAECPFRYVKIPAELGGDNEGELYAPENGAFQNALVKYESNGHVYIYAADGIPTRVTISGELVNDFNQLMNRPKYAGSDMTSSTNIPDVGTTVSAAVAIETTAREAADTVLDDAKVDKETGKGLSTNDYTTADKTKLGDLEDIYSVGDGLSLNTSNELSADVKDVQVGSASVVTNKIANIPLLTGPNTLGLVKVQNWNTGNINYDGSGTIYLTPQTVAQLTARNAGNGIVNASNMDNAVRLALTDGVGAAYTDTEKTAARDRIGATSIAQGNTLATTAPTTSTAGVLGQLYTDTTNMHTYQLTAISGTTYTWTQRW